MALKRHRSSISDCVIDYVVYIFCALMALITFYPLLYVLMGSFSSNSAIAQYGALLVVPIQPTLEAYEAVFQNKMIWSGYANTLFYVVVGTALSLFLTVMAGYVMSRRWLYGKKAINIYIVITMFFSGGMVPLFLVVQQLGLLENRWSIILPGLVSAYNLIVTRTFFQGISDSMEESGKVDGANDFQILMKIYVPLAIPVIAVMLLFYAVAMWNSWYNASIFMPRGREMWPLQLVLRQILVQGNMADMGGQSMGTAQSIAKNLKYATIVVATAPILFVYPFLQKYFAKGVMIGAVKG